VGGGLPAEWAPLLLVGGRVGPPQRERLPCYKLIISHEAGDEGFDYAEWLKEYACEHQVDLRLVTTHIADPWQSARQPGTALSLWDVYPHADFFTYPSLYEGFGNAFLEAIYFRKPLLVNRYATFVRDIEPLGFDLAVMDGYLSKQTVQCVRDILSSRVRRQQMVDTNYVIAARHYSFRRLREQLNLMLAALFGESAVTLVKRGPDEEMDGVLTFDPTQVAFKRFSNRSCAGPIGN